MKPTGQLRALRTPLLKIQHAIPVSSALRAQTRPVSPLFFSRTTTGLRYHSSSHSSRSTAADPSAANPPPSTRPPPLVLPNLDPATTNTFSRLFAKGKAYITFYKTGLRAILTNYKLRTSILPASPPPPHSSIARTANNSSSKDAIAAANEPSTPPREGTRAALQLKARVTHDLARLPLFGFMLLICPEFTPLVVVLFPRAVPLTCRIPRQVDVLDRRTEARRAASFADLAVSASASSLAPSSMTTTTTTHTAAETDRHIARSLGLVGSAWDKIGWVPAMLSRTRVSRRLRFLAEDDELLARAGGVDALVADEVRLACADRGVDVRGKDEAALRSLLGEWLRFTAAVGTGKNGSGAGEGKDRDVRIARIRELLVRRPEDWPSRRT